MSVAVGVVSVSKMCYNVTRMTLVYLILDRFRNQVLLWGARHEFDIKLGF